MSISAWRARWLTLWSNFFQAEDGIRDLTVTGVQTCALPIYPVILGASEGLQGSSLNQGNFMAARRLVADMTLRPWWGNFAASMEVLVPPPAGSRLWYDDRHIPFLAEDVKDAAAIQQSLASTMKSLSDGGWEPDAVVAAVMAGDLRLLKGAHSGLFSVQLQPPGPKEPAPEPVNGQMPKDDANALVVHKDDRCPAGKPWAVVKDSDNSLEGCHMTEAEAQDQQAALYANEGRAAMPETESAMRSHMTAEPPEGHGMDSDQMDGMSMEAMQQRHNSMHESGAEHEHPMMKSATVPGAERADRPPRDNLVRSVMPGVELRAEDDAKPTLFGHFAVFDQWTEIDSAFEGHFMRSEEHTSE